MIEVKFVKFDLEESDECEFDSLKVMAGEDEGEFIYDLPSNCHKLTSKHTKWVLFW